MKVKFISHVDQNDNGNWFIKLTDTLENTDVICKDLSEYENKIQELGSEYGGEIEVVWTKSKILSPSNYQDISTKMDVLKEKYQEEIESIK